MLGDAFPGTIVLGDVMGRMSANSQLVEVGKRAANIVARPGRRKLIVQIGLLSLILLALYSHVVADLAEVWWSRDDYAHGFLIPIISLYLVWSNRTGLLKLPVKPNFIAGILVCLASGMLLLLGNTGGVLILSGSSLITMIAGLVMLYLGTAFAKTLALPILYLFFMVPVLDLVIFPLQWPLQLLSAKMGVALLQAWGYSALLRQQYIILPRITLEVADVCSGTAFLVSIMAIGLPLAYLVLRTWWSRMVLLLAAVAIGITANWVRVAVIGVWASWGHEVVHGPLHLFQGMSVAWVGFAWLFIGAWGLGRVEKALHGKIAATRPAKDDRADHPPVQFEEWDRSWWIAIVILGVFAVYQFTYTSKPVKGKENLASFPMSFGGWIGETAELHQALFRISGIDHELFRTYRDSTGRQLQLYVADLRLGEGREKLGDSRMAPLHQRAERITIRISPDQVISVNRGILGDRSREHRIIFWYDVNRRVMADRYLARLLMAVEGLWGRSDGAFVMIDLPDGTDAKERREEEDFVRKLLPFLQRYLS